MRRVIVRVRAVELSGQLAYEKLKDFPRYKELTTAVREIVMLEPDQDGSVVSQWTVVFRNGLLCWTERDFFDPRRLTIRFVQLSGDFEVFHGEWRVDNDEAGATVTFDAEFDLGMPSIAAILDPVAEATLRDNILVILRGLLGDVVSLDAGEAELAAATHD